MQNYFLGLRQKLLADPCTKRDCYGLRLQTEAMDLRVFDVSLV